MSSSRGIMVLPKDSEIMPPEALRRMVLGRDPSRRSDLELGELSPLHGRRYRAEAGEPFVPFTHLVTVAQTVGERGRRRRDAGAGRYEEAARDKEKLAPGASPTPAPGPKWAPESMRLQLLSVEETKATAKGLDEDQREYPRRRRGELSLEMSGDEVQRPRGGRAGAQAEEAFAAVYTVLLGKKSGPKAGPSSPGCRSKMVREEVPVVMKDTNIVRGVR